ncbi:hypothetical protein [uncultured Paraglaciecola sp.]|uniref:hypothetical protein n=1 Tax=uncultured Paraglaciecola sp. TaxID=1765024 RepID=UPI00261D4C79|nr:hypothetical protein [uncultured Paraglaciecola sp.]
MCIQGLLGGSNPEIPAPQQIRTPPRIVDTEVKQARDDTKRKARAATGSASTVRTSDKPTSTGKVLLGQ